MNQELFHIRKYKEEGEGRDIAIVVTQECFLRLSCVRFKVA